MRSWKELAVIGGTLLLSSGLIVGCGSDDSGSGDASASASDTALVLYSGRSEELVGPLIERVGGTVPVKATYDRKAAQILEEGDRSPADLFFAQDAGELGALAEAGLLAPLPEDIKNAVLEPYRSETGGWVPTSARSRVLIYNPNNIGESELPEGIDGLLAQRFRGQVGYAPTNASFKSFVTALRLVRGEDGARDWLTKFLANDPKKFDGNGAIVEAVNSGSLATGLTNHYYWVQEINEKGAAAVPSKLHFFSNGDPGALVNVAGIGVLKSSKKQEQAFEFARQLLTPETQEFFATEVGEYPVIEGVQLNVAGIPPLSELQPPKINLDDLSDVQGTEKLLTEVGAI
ncbi:iron ABC transporter substrate-binding protein [Gordonia sp. w5E2]|mgnify:CR=1 FL=1|uniref:iron ABC transporter substrate-binding protein n=1 Tax=Gordonia TaxID=2053 RepID=UPI000672598B|nr:MULTISPECIES: iron ABC transporter substrate-binding protein [Gordonia]SKZ77118.1 extracellular solute-binding protein [Mycobacteroides abscessus subsp. abscessus]